MKTLEPQLEKNHMSDDDVKRISHELLRQLTEELKGEGEGQVANVFAEKIADVAWARFQMAVGKSVVKNIVMLLIIGAICTVAWWKLNVDPYIHAPSMNVDK